MVRALRVRESTGHRRHCLTGQTSPIRLVYVYDDAVQPSRCEDVAIFTVDLHRSLSYIPPQLHAMHVLHAEPACFKEENPLACAVCAIYATTSSIIHPADQEATLDQAVPYTFRFTLYEFLTTPTLAARSTLPFSKKPFCCV